jgi:hypothetical protein
VEKHILFLDTSIFESENFFKGRNLNHLCELSKSGQIEIKITDIIYREVQHRIKENVLKAQSAFKKAYALITGEGKILKNLEDYEIPKVDAEEVIKTLTKRFDHFIKQNKIEIINSEISNIKEVFNDYFETNPPFQEGKKKTEFPDAFTYSTLKEWSNQNDKKVYFLSNDSDFNKLSSDNIDCSHSLSTIIDLIARELDEKYTALIQETYEDSKFEIVSSLEKDFTSELAEAVYNQLENDPFYEDVEVETADDIDVEIVIGVINEVINNSSFSYEIESNITFSIRVEYTDLSSGIYDKEDGVWWGQERVSETKEYSANVIAIAEFSYDLEREKGFYYMMSNFTIQYIEEQ